jgi:hypothetical protein
MESGKRIEALTHCKTRQPLLVPTMLRSAASSALRRAQRPLRASSMAARAFASSSNGKEKLSYTKVPKEDFGQYTEYSVIFTNRALNLMSDPFQKVMRDLNNLLKVTYNAEKVAIIPGCVSVFSAKCEYFTCSCCSLTMVFLHTAVRVPLEWSPWLVNLSPMNMP